MSLLEIRPSLEWQLAQVAGSLSPAFGSVIRHPLRVKLLKDVDAQRNSQFWSRMSILLPRPSFG